MVGVEEADVAALAEYELDVGGGQGNGGGGGWWGDQGLLDFGFGLEGGFGGLGTVGDDVVAVVGV